MINKLINLANSLDESGFKKEADRVDALIKKLGAAQAVIPISLMIKILAALMLPLLIPQETKEELARRILERAQSYDFDGSTDNPEAEAYRRLERATEEILKEEMSRDQSASQPSEEGGVASEEGGVASEEGGAASEKSSIIEYLKWVLRDLTGYPKRLPAPDIVGTSDEWDPSKEGYAISCCYIVAKRYGGFDFRGLSDQRQRSFTGWQGRPEDENDNLMATWTDDDGNEQTQIWLYFDGPTISSHEFNILCKWANGEFNADMNEYVKRTGHDWYGYPEDDYTVNRREQQAPLASLRVLLNKLPKASKSREQGGGIIEELSGVSEIKSYFDAKSPPTIVGGLNPWTSSMKDKIRSWVYKYKISRSRAYLKPNISVWNFSSWKENPSCNNFVDPSLSKDEVREYNPERPYWYEVDERRSNAPHTRIETTYDSETRRWTAENPEGDVRQWRDHMGDYSKPLPNERNDSGLGMERTLHSLHYSPRPGQVITITPIDTPLLPGPDPFDSAMEELDKLEEYTGFKTPSGILPYSDGD
tara:strand:+ start:10363 stop:11961 length:1599 start_codon:yes stop_codon:yes gene_type:complete